MNVVVEYDDAQNKYTVPLKYVASELNIDLESLEQAVKRAVEKH